MGDVKLAVSLGLMAGIVQLIAGFLVASIGGALVLVALLATRAHRPQVRHPVRPDPAGGRDLCGTWWGD